MKYRDDIYAKALAGALLDAKSQEGEKKLLAQFAKLVVKNGDVKRLRAILTATERLLAKRGKGALVTIESARPLSGTALRKIIAALPKNSRVEERIAPSLIAGVRITVNDERELDASLKARLQTLFI